MIRTRIRKIISDVWTRKVRTLLVSSSIFVGVFGVVTLFSTGEILVNQLEKDIRQDRLAMLRIQVSAASGAAIDNAAALDALRRQPGVTAVEGRAIYPLFWKRSGEERFREGTIAAYANPFDQTQLEPPRLVAGEYPAQGQIAVERRMADKYGLGVGDTLDLRILSQENGAAGDIPQQTYTISGIVFQPYGELGGTGPLDASALVYAPYDEARHIAAFTGLSLIYARFVDYGAAEQEKASFQAAVASNSPYVPVFASSEDPAKNSQIESTRSTNRVLVILAMVALVVSGFLVINVINSIVVEQRRQIGVMKSLGATRLDNFVMYAGIALAYGVIGVVPGVLLGIPGGYFGAKGLAAQNQTIIENFSVSPTAVVLGVVVGLAVPFLAAVLPVLNGTRVSILSAMTDFGIKADYGRGPLARLITRLPLPLPLRQALHNVNQKKFRLALTGTTLTIAVGAFMGIFAVFSSLGDVIDNVFAAFGAHTSIQPNEGQPFDAVRAALTSPEFAARLDAQGLPGLKAVEPAASLSIEIGGYTPPPTSAGPPGIFAYGFNTENPEIAQLTYTEGGGWEDNPAREGVVISSYIAKNMHKHVGDSIVIQAGGGRAAFEIIGVASYPFDTVWMPWQTLARLGGLTLGGPGAGRPADQAYVTPAGELYPNQIDLILDASDPSVKTVDAVIDLANEALIAQGITSQFTNWVEFKQTITQFVRVFNVILYLAAALIAAVGAIGLLTSLSMSVFERQKEIGVMRSVGASSWTVAGQFLVEGLIVGVVAWAIGVPLSYFLGQGLIAALPFENLDVGFPLFTLIVGLAGMLIVVTLASLWPSLAAARKTVSDILRYQ